MPRPIQRDEDRSLLDELRACDDSEGPFRKVFERYHRKLVGFFTRRGILPQRAQELSQDTFVRVYRSRRTIRDDLPLGAWIFTLAANVLRNERRRENAGMRRGDEVSLEDETTASLAEIHAGPDPAGPAGPLAAALDRELVDAVWEVLRECPPQMRRTAQLRYQHDYDVAEIASLLGVARSTVNVQLFLARRRLRAALTERFGELPW